MKKKMIIIVAAFVLIFSLGVSYAYFKAQIVGKGTPISATAKNVRIIFTDTLTLSGTNIEPGWSDSKTFSVRNDSYDVFIYNIIFKDLVNTFETSGFLQYKITSSNGYNMTDYLDIPKISTPSNKPLAKKVSIPAGVTQEYTIEFIYKTTEEDQSADMGKSLSGTLAIEEYDDPTQCSNNTLACTIIKAYNPQPGRTDFTTIDNGTPTLYTDEDDQGETYYFSGDGSQMNNWVEYAVKLWRVIRINGNGSVRLLYAGTGGEDGYIGSAQAYNGSERNPMYVGWKYTVGDSLDTIRENTNKSDVYTTVENWYNALSNTDKNYIDGNAIYCNDRNLASGDSYSESGAFQYAAGTRLDTNKTPTFECSNEADKFYNFGLMTADEVSYAGGVYDINNTYAYYYLNASGGDSTGTSAWWTMTPFEYNLGYAEVFVVSGSRWPGEVYWGFVGTTSIVVRPVVSLKKEVVVTGGDGSANNPYTVTLP